MTEAVSIDEEQVDRRIGERIRARRVELGLTQEQLAQSLGVSYQQIQKYENGANRIAAARLARLARRLDLPVEHFVAEQGLATASSLPPEQATLDEPGRRAVHELARGFAAIDDQGVRHALTALVKAVADRRV